MERSSVTSLAFARDLINSEKQKLPFRQSKIFEIMPVSEQKVIVSNENYSVSIEHKE
jgi:hypothetical protein